jgi:DNA repair protein RecO (recombination protein O)
MPSFNTHAVVLKNFQYQDADKIYTLLSKDKGRISVIGKGVRKVTSRRAGNMDTLNHVVVQVDRHKSGILYLQEVKTLATHKRIKTNDKLSNKAFYLVELINRTVEEDEYAQKIYRLLVKTLARLEEGNEEPSLTVNKFEIKLMQFLGYQPPRQLLRLWKAQIEEKEFEKADRLLKDYITEILQEKMKSLELE